MSYTIHAEDGTPHPIRFIGPGGRVFAPFVPEEWWVDPCAHSSRRYRVRHADSWAEYPWYAVVIVTDDERAIASKVSYYQKVEDAEQAVHDAKNALHALVR